MLRLDLTLPTLAENLALDEALLLQDGEGVLRFWQWPSLAVVVGAGGKLADEVELDRCARDGVPIARRGSGGGTVLLGPGCLLYSLILPIAADPAFADLTKSYRVIMSRIANALAAEIPGIALADKSDLAWRDRKFSGNAQQRKRSRILHHGTLLFDFDLAQIATYVKHPPRMPDYRRDRPHDAFVTNVPIPEARLRTLIATEWNAQETPIPLPPTATLVEEKYAREDWRSRR